MVRFAGFIERENKSLQSLKAKSQGIRADYNKRAKSR